MTTRTAPEVVLSYGMGADSTALLARWIFEPQTRPATSPTCSWSLPRPGNEWPVTGKLVTHHVLPLMREYGIRWAQVARAGPRRADGITVLDDTRQPAAVCLDGDYKLSDELTAAGTAGLQPMLGDESELAQRCRERIWQREQERRDVQAGRFG